MAVQQTRKFNGDDGIPVPNAYVRIVKGSIRGGGPQGWSCTMEVFTKAEHAQTIEIPRAVAEIPEHMRRDPQTGNPLNDEALETIASALPPVMRMAGQPYERFEFPQNSAPGAGNIVPDDGETHPAKALYGAYMKRNPDSKQV